MAQTAALVHTLKKQLKAQGKTYCDVAQALGLSEASVKRLFSEQNFTLQRLEVVAQLAGLELTELFRLLARDQQRLTQLTREQEQEIASDLELLLITVSVINGFSFSDILTHYQVSEHTCIQKLAKLDRLKIIELQPNNRVKLLVDPNFSWLPNGPIQQFFQQKVEQDFFSSRFDKQHEKLIVLNGVMTAETNLSMQKKMERLAEEFNSLIQDDTPLPMDKKHGNTMVIAIRQWQYSLFKNYKKV
ncbi:helix-turn-helix domain-containing protein [Amphritea balenae]|uniref:XRE family transcriptional regulator n=1 Tax=Amphritea balenae TaxID=452629 RepID=A0A3P1SJ98_9GAMM|nr:helix-turn-helix domain-containing protein [Amphritea balenae]RRC97040.1 XRE family transcriptional regulator [Amphritea balenae]GGK67533.1 transcriptional regulator [Amphritea balenae]